MYHDYQFTQNTAHSGKAAGKLNSTRLVYILSPEGGGVLTPRTSY